jgi:hypothetical protein
LHTLIRDRDARADTLFIWASDPVHAAPLLAYTTRSLYIESMLAGVMRDSMKLTSACGDCFDDAAAVASLNFWFDDSVDAKFIRASIMPVENHPCPSVQPATSGGS